MTRFLCSWLLRLQVRCFSVGMCWAVCQNTGGLDRARVSVSTFQVTTCYFIRLTLVIKINSPPPPHMSSRFFYDTVSISFTAERSWHLVWYQLSKVSTSSNCERRSALRQLWQREMPFLLSADNQNLGRGEGGGRKKVSASNKQIFNSDERPWESIQGQKALRTGKPMFICNHICDVWQHYSVGWGGVFPPLRSSNLF